MVYDLLRAADGPIHKGVEVGVRNLVAEALQRGREKQPGLSADPEQYAIYNFSIGFEGIGHWKTEAEISVLSLTGVRK